MSRLPARIGYEVTNEAIETLFAQAAEQTDSLDGLVLEQLAREEQERLAAWLSEQDAERDEQRRLDEEADRAEEEQRERDFASRCAPGGDLR